jgi:hypothetical protein
MLSDPGTEQRLAELMKSAWANEGSRQELLRDPTDFIRRSGIEIPEEFEVKVSAEKDSVSLRIIPNASGEGELTDSSLSKVTGGYLVFNFKLVAVKTISWS